MDGIHPTKLVAPLVEARPTQSVLPAKLRDRGVGFCSPPESMMASPSFSGNRCLGTVFTDVRYRTVIPMGLAQYSSPETLSRVVMPETPDVPIEDPLSGSFLLGEKEPLGYPA